MGKVSLVKMRKIKILLRLLYSYTSKERRELAKVSKCPRYTLNETKIFEFPFEYIDSTSFIGQYNEIIKNKIYDFKCSSDMPLIIDCGSNIGLSIVALKKQYPKARIIAFEPDPIIFKTLEKNVLIAKYNNVELHQKAVWITESKLSFYQDGSAGGRLLSNKTDMSIEVNTVDLKKFIVNPVNLLKIDIEGAETTILNDISTVLSYVNNIFIEYHSSIKEKQNLQSILSVLSDNGFRYYIESSKLSTSPFIKRNCINNFDNLLNIFGYR